MAYRDQELEGILLRPGSSGHKAAGTPQSGGRHAEADRNRRCATAATSAAAEKRMVWRPNAKGELVQVNANASFENCVRGGMKMGFPRIGPGGEDDPKGAVGDCKQRSQR
jgi:hypothetical protein